MFDGSLQLAILMLGAFLLGVIVVSMSMAAGYWAGRNSRELPFRSANNVKRERPPDPERRPTDEPEGDDIFNEAAYGRDSSPVPTIIEGRR